MQKTKLNKFIQKYNLGGNVNSVKWKAGTDKLTFDSKSAIIANVYLSGCDCGMFLF